MLYTPPTKRLWGEDRVPGLKRIFLLALRTVLGLFIVGALLVAAWVALFVWNVTSEDDFAADLEIPKDIEIAEPKEWSEADFAAEDDFSIFLRKAAGTEDADVNRDISLDNLEAVYRTSEPKFRRYLATHPGWRFSGKPGRREATRRRVVDSAWRITLNGYYQLAEHRNLRQTIYLDKPRGKIGTPREDNSIHQIDDLLVETWAEKAPGLRLAMLEFLEAEMGTLNKTEQASVHQQMLEQSYVRRGEGSFELFNSFQPGIYDSHLWVNPGEPGMIYLKAFEITQGTALSTSRLPGSTSEWIGWSDDSEELFFSNSHFTIYEGDWGDPYAARFEVWFAPEAGGPERKLMEKNYIIEGWMR